MGRLLLCRGTEGKHPLYIKELGLNVYSAEELSYYIFNHAFFLDESFFSDELYAFLAQECRMPALEKKLRTAVNEGQDFATRVMLIQEEIHYYTDFELLAFKEKLTQIVSASAAERMKSQGDFMLQQQKYESALRLYDNALAETEKEPDDRLRSRILCNRGSVYARLFAFREAAECFEKAYALEESEEMISRLFMVYQLDPSIPVRESLIDKIPAEKLHKWQEEMDVLKKNSSYKGKALEAREILEKNSVRRVAELEKMLMRWKQEYRGEMA